MPSASGPIGTRNSSRSPSASWLERVGALRQDRRRPGRGRPARTAGAPGRPARGHRARCSPSPRPAPSGRIGPSPTVTSNCSADTSGEVVVGEPLDSRHPPTLSPLPSSSKEQPMTESLHAAPCCVRAPSAWSGALRHAPTAVAAAPRPSTPAPASCGSAQRFASSTRTGRWRMTLTRSRTSTDGPARQPPLRSHVPVPTAGPPQGTYTFRRPRVHPDDAVRRTRPEPADVPGDRVQRAAQASS